MKKLFYALLIVALVCGFAVAETNYNRFQGGVTVGNIPILNTYGGKVFWVDSGAGSDGNKGTFDRPFGTIDYAIGRCTSANGDIIMVKPGHTEAIAAAGGITLDVASVAIVGLGTDTDRPTITYSTSASADIEVDAANCSIINMVIDMTGKDALTGAIDVDAAGFTMAGCSITTADSQGQIKHGIVLDANADNFTFKDCIAKGSTDTGGSDFITMGAVAPSNVTIKNSSIEGDYGNACIFGSGTPDNLLIQDVYVRNYQDGDHGIELSGNATGRLINVYASTSAVATAVDPGTCELFNVLWYDDDHTADAVGVDVYSGGDSDLGVDAITDALYGADGIATWANGAAPANAVSLSEGLRDVWDVLRNGTGGTEPDTNKSIIDAIGTNGTTLVDGTGSVIGVIGVNDNDNSFDSTSVAANENGSVMERLEQIQEAVNAGTGTSIGANKSVVDLLGTTGVALVDDALSVVGIIGVNDNNNAFSSSSVVPNQDGSVLERLEAGTPHVAVNLDVELDVGSVANVFTISGGHVEIMGFWATLDEAVSANACTVKFVYDPTNGATDTDLGTVINISGTAQYSTLWLTGDVSDATAVAVPGTDLPHMMNGTIGEPLIVSPGTVDYTAGGTAPTAGKADIYLFYRPLEDGAYVTGD
jgi:hypothetical protein